MGIKYAAVLPWNLSHFIYFEATSDEDAREQLLIMFHANRVKKIVLNRLDENTRYWVEV